MGHSYVLLNSTIEFHMFLEIFLANVQLNFKKDFACNGVGMLYLDFSSHVLIIKMKCISEEGHRDSPPPPSLKISLGLIP